MPEPFSIRELDVRPLIAAGRPPIDAILAAVRDLPAGGALRLVAPFEPKPLFGKLGEMGFSARSEQQPDGSFAILFSPAATAPGPTPPAPADRHDLRHLEPPGPMQRVLELVADLAAGQNLVAVTRFQPIHLLTMLDERGLRWSCTERPDGGWETTVTRPSATP